MAEPEGIQRAVVELARRLGLARPAETARLFSSWEQIVGPEVARRARPVDLREGVLRVTASSPAWAGELRYLAPELIRRVAAELGEGLVSEVRISVERPGGTGPRPGPRRPRKPGRSPRDR